MKYICVDVESDGPAPALFSMISLGAIVLDDQLNKTFYTELKPISENWNEEALAVSKFTREQTLKFPDAYYGIFSFYDWLNEIKENDNLLFCSDNNGFDWQFVNYYFWKFLNTNPFGHTSMNIGSLYKGMMKNMKANFKHLRKTKHSHNPLDDSRGNAEVLNIIFENFEK